MSKANAYIKTTKDKNLKKQSAVYNSGTLMTAGMNWYIPSKVIIKQSLRDLPYTVSPKKANSKAVVKSENINYVPYICVNITNSVIFMIWLIYLTILQSFN